MKKYTKIVGCLMLGGVLFSGCKDYLDRQPLDQLSQETFFRNSGEVAQALVPTYLRYRSLVIGGMGSGNGSSLDMEALTDNAYSTSGFQSLQNIAQGGLTSAIGGATSEMWTACWQGVAYCNFFLDNIDRKEVKAVLSTADYKKYKGEALFNRCYFYNLLVQHFGDVPLITTSVTADMPYLDSPRTAKNEVVAQMLKDIDEAIGGLPQVAYSDGHAVKGSAIFLKVRILMNNNMFAEAATTAYSLIGASDNPFKLSDNYAGIFFDNQKNNPEIMFSVMYSSPDDMHQFDQYTGSRMSCYPLWDLAKAFEEKSQGVDDPRKHMTLIMVGDPWVMNSTNSGTFKYKLDQSGRSYSYSAGTFPPYGAKSLLSESSIPKHSMAWKKGVNPLLIQARDKISFQHRIMMRYADLLLLYAEAMVESGQGADPKALKALNDVRGRKGVEMPAKTSLTRDIVRNERRVELAYEGVRLYDLIRWNTLKDVIPPKNVDPNVSNPAKCKWDGTNLWPIPQNVMNIMKDKWINNSPY
jgi:hypothetical protein